MALHGSWDVSATLGTTIGGMTLAALMTPLLLVIGIVIILIVGRDAGGSERTWAREILAPEVERGSMTEAEMIAVSGTHKDRKHFIKSVHGHHHHRVAKHALAAGRELLEEIGRSGGEETERVAHARAELVRLRPE